MTHDPEKTLAWEKRHRPRAGIAAILGAIGLLVYYVTLERLGSGGPQATSGLDTLERVGQPGPVGDLPSLRLAEFQYVDDSRLLLLTMGICALVGFVGMAWAVGFLGVATRARAPEFRRYLIYVPIVGGVIYGLGVFGDRLALTMLARDFLDGPRTVAAAGREATGLQQFSQLLLSLGSLVLAVGIVFVSLHAMRVGLLTKLFGYLGIVAGALLVLVPLPVVQIFWLAGVGLLLLGRWPGGAPPAWRTGTAEPWPVPQRAGRPRAEAATQPAEPRSSSRSKRKKRH